MESDIFVGVFGGSKHTLCECTLLFLSTYMPAPAVTPLFSSSFFWPEHGTGWPPPLPHRRRLPLQGPRHGAARPNPAGLPWPRASPTCPSCPGRRQSPPPAAAGSLRAESRSRGPLGWARGPPACRTTARDRRRRVGRWRGGAGLRHAALPGAASRGLKERERERRRERREESIQSRPRSSSILHQMCQALVQPQDPVLGHTRTHFLLSGAFSGWNYSMCSCLFLIS